MIRILSKIHASSRRVLLGMCAALCCGSVSVLAAGVATGDPVIDEAQHALERLDSKGAAPDARLNEAFGVLFARPAFESIREEGWRYMLFTLIKSRQLVEQYAPRYADPKRRAGLQQVAATMARLQGELVVMYGPKFSLDEHLKRYPANRDAFTQNLPTPQQAPTGKFFDRFDAGLRELRTQLKEVGLVEY